MICKPRTPRRLTCLLLVFALTVIAGCGSPKDIGTVSGTVTIDGQPAEKGSITFMPMEGGNPSSGATIENGKYSASVWPGKSKVEIRVPKVVGETKLYNTPDSPVQQILTEVLPARFNDRTELELEVQLGKNEKNWELSVHEP